MKVTTTKSKNSESFYITKSYVNNEGKSTSKTIRNYHQQKLFKGGYLFPQAIYY